MVSLNIFKNDAFTTIQLTQAVEKVPYLPLRLGKMGIFEQSPIRTKMAMVEERQGQLFIIPFSKRGSEGTQRTTEKRKMRAFEVPRIRVDDTIYAEELIGIREFGTESELMQVQTEVARRFDGPTGLKNLVNITKEYHRIAAIQGLLLDADGTVMYNWFDEFQVTQPTEVAFNLSAGTVGGTSGLRTLINDSILRPMQRAAQGAWIDDYTQAAALVGDSFYDQLTSHPEVRETYRNWVAAAELRKNVGEAFGVFNYGGIDWYNYRGTDDNSTIKITTTTAKFFPVNAPGVFKEILSPGESFEDLQTPGRDVYARVIPDLQRNEWAKIELSSYPLHICTRPGMLFSGRAGT